MLEKLADRKCEVSLVGKFEVEIIGGRLLKFGEVGMQSNCRLLFTCLSGPAIWLNCTADTTRWISGALNFSSGVSKKQRWEAMSR